MMLTIDIIRQWFDTFNRQYFGGSLPHPTFKLSRARTRLGSMQCVRRRALLAKPQRIYTIFISTYYKCDERGYQTVLLHEMIHYYISYNDMRDTSPHGTLFRRMMDDINSHGWHITVSTNTTGWETSASACRRSKHLLLLATTTRGEMFLSSVAIRSAWALHDSIAHAKGQIADEQWYVSTDSRFDSFTKVRSLRGRKIKDKAELDDFLSVMQHIDTQELFSGYYRL